MRILLAVLLFPSLAFCDQVPDFIRNLPTTGFSNPLIDKDGNEEIFLDGQPAIRTRDGRIVRSVAASKVEVAPEIVKIVEATPERPHAPPVFEDDAAAPQFVLTWKQECVAQLKKIVDVPIAAFRAAPDKIEQKVCDILPVPDRQHATKKTNIPYNLDVKEFVETSRDSAPVPATIAPTKIETPGPTAEQLRLMKEYGFSTPPTIQYLDGSITKGVSILVPNGESQYREASDKVQYNTQGTVECESCRRMRDVRR